MHDPRLAIPTLEPQELFLAVSQGANGAELGIAITGLDPSLPLLYTNDALFQMTGLQASDNPGSSLRTLLPSGERQRVEGLLWALGEGEPSSRTLETVFFAQDGRVIPVELSCTRVLVGAQLAVVSFVTDLSDRKRVEEELRGSETRFRHLVSAAPDGVLILHGTRLLYANASAAKLFDVTEPEQLIGRDLQDSLSAESLKAVGALDQLMRGTGTCPDPFEVVTRAGRVAEISVIALEYEGRPAILGFARDVTERKAIQARLLQADRLAAVGLLAAGVAHEINNPLAYVLLNLKYLARELPKLAADPSRLEVLQKHVADANHGAERVQNIVRDLRMFARTDDEAPGPVDLVQVVESALAMADHELRQCARIRRTYLGNFAVNGTAAKLEQVFLNLLVNATQAIGRGAADQHFVDIRLEPWSNGMVRATISDTGPGITPNILDRAFEPFFTTKPPGVGTGLGLPICKSIIEAFGGGIRVESNPGQGTRVYLELREHPDEPPLPSSKRPSSAELPAARRARLLIVDDEQPVASMLARFLEASYEVVTAAGGVEALDLVLRDHFDVVLCDIMMPEMTGMEFYQRLQQRAPLVRDRLVFMTGGSLLPEVSAFLSRVERPKIEKPFDLQELRRILARISQGPLGARLES